MSDKKATENMDISAGRISSFCMRDNLVTDILASDFFFDMIVDAGEGKHFRPTVSTTTRTD